MAISPCMWSMLEIFSPDLSFIFWLCLWLYFCYKKFKNIVKLFISTFFYHIWILCIVSVAYGFVVAWSAWAAWHCPESPEDKSLTGPVKWAPTVMWGQPPATNPLFVNLYASWWFRLQEWNLIQLESISLHPHHTETHQWFLLLLIWFHFHV